MSTTQTYRADRADHTGEPIYLEAETVEAAAYTVRRRFGANRATGARRLTGEHGKTGVFMATHDVRGGHATDTRGSAYHVFGPLP